VTNPDERGHGITFEVDILNHSTADLSIKLALTESVAVQTGSDGSRVIDHVDDMQTGTDGAITWIAKPWTN
jgi:hypothetical protein